LRYENARLNGEKGKLKIAPNVPPRKPKLPSVEKSKQWSKDSKNPRIEITLISQPPIPLHMLPGLVLHREPILSGVD
jgi:hypothetical protein